MNSMRHEEVQNIQYSDDLLVSPRPISSVDPTPTLTPYTDQVDTDQVDTDQVDTDQVDTDQIRLETLVTKDQMDIAIDRLSEIEACLLVGISFIAGYGVCRILYSAIMKCF